MAMATAAAAATRSRRAEGRAKEPAAPSQQQQQPVQQQQQQQQQQPQQQQLARAKRARDFTDHGDRDTVVAKKPRLGIAVEFPTKPLPPPPPPPPPSRPTTSSVASNSSSSNSSSNSRDGGAAEVSCLSDRHARPSDRQQLAGPFRLRLRPVSLTRATTSRSNNSSNGRKAAQNTRQRSPMG